MHIDSNSAFRVLVSPNLECGPWKQVNCSPLRVWASGNLKSRPDFCIMAESSTLPWHPTSSSRLTWKLQWFDVLSCWRESRQSVVILLCMNMDITLYCYSTLLWQLQRRDRPHCQSSVLEVRRRSRGKEGQHNGWARDRGQHAQYSGGRKLQIQSNHSPFSMKGAGDGSLQAPERRRRTRTSQQVIVTMEGRWKRICALNELI